MTSVKFLCLALSCPKLDKVSRTRVLEQYNVINGYASFTCDVNHLFAVGGTNRIVVCQADGQWSQNVQPCQGWLPVYEV